MLKTLSLLLAALLWLPALAGSATAQAIEDVCSDLPATLPAAGAGEAASRSRRVVCADVAALDQTLVYNRFGSYNPFGMIFALRRDLVAADTLPTQVTAADCAADDGTTKPLDPALSAGNVRLRDCRRPRPLVLRAREGDLLVVQVTNLLRLEQPGHSETFCRGRDLAPDARRVRAEVSEGNPGRVDHDEVACLSGTLDMAPEAAAPGAADWPRTRTLSFGMQGLVAVRDPRAAPGDPEAARALSVCRGLHAIEPDASVTCFYEVDRAGPYFFASEAAPSGGEGDGGSITHGLFGAVVVHEPGTTWYRSQVSRAALDTAWTPASGTDAAALAARLATGNHARSGGIDYDAVGEGGLPVLAMLHQPDPAKAHELVHADLNAIVWRPGTYGGALSPDGADDGGRMISYREFGVFFHDELKTFYTRNFEELERYGQLAGVRDGFAINYGSSGMGSLLLANRKGIGPASECIECLYEEFFLTSWANGDPALLERYADDPSNVHHSYLGDPIRFRNFHAGPKETHVFHLHAHQWFAGNDRNRGAYLDSQTVAPQQGFTYEIYDGGLAHYDAAEPDDWLHPGGSGNRNRTVGDSIFHCHLYPHFAQGMWELWRVHDVFEDGTRLLPDGQGQPGLSVALRDDDAVRAGSVDQETGIWIADAEGTPIPALVPLPGRPLPVLPSYADPARIGTDEDAPSQLVAADVAAEAVAFPGYPFYIGARPGHRPPQAPMDLAVARRDEAGTSGAAIAAGEMLDGGLPRHTLTGGDRTLSVGGEEDVAAATGEAGREARLSQLVARMLALGDMTAHLDAATLRLLPYEGTALERAAMGFHGDGLRWGDGTPVGALGPDGNLLTPTPDGGWPTGNAGGPRGGAPADAPDRFTVNGAPPKPGAPFADPCGAPDGLQRGPGPVRDPFLAFLGDTRPDLDFRLDPAVAGFRRYEASAVQLDLVTNRAGWHDPQARINVLTERSDLYKANTSGIADPISPYVSAREEPFFFRAFSGECIEFRHTNETPKDLELDDFQVRTPTDTIGQHIHLVKFDVTSSDGSANGWNYEDGTLAPDEVAARICAARNRAGEGVEIVADRAPGQLALRDDGLCSQDAEGHWAPAIDDIWKLERGAAPQRFQTTVQRWFADPILSETGLEGGIADRTMRTVFSHDHFAPSSIQQHGFYTALLVEPSDRAVCAARPDGACKEFAGPPAVDLATGMGAPSLTVDETGPDMVGTHRLLIDPGGQDEVPVTVHPDTREYAIAIADFAVLYDPRDTDALAEDAISSGSPKGIAKLACEARAWAGPPFEAHACGSDLAQDASGRFDGDDPIPAWTAAGRPGDAASHNDLLAGMMSAEDADSLAAHLESWRTRAALSNGGRLARPVAPPERPESISVDHHDPYLVNYRGEPIPLRIGTKESGDESDCALANLPFQRTLAALVDGDPDPADEASIDDAAFVRDARPCSVSVQRTGAEGDMANVFLSGLHGDPATIPIEAYAGEPVLVRMIQGAQEVQHLFSVESFVWKRNLDQAFPQASPVIGRDAPEITQNLACNRLDAARLGYPEYYRAHAEGKLAEVSAPQAVRDHFDALEAASARCLDIEGYATAQEIGISEHFEIKGEFRQTHPNAVLFAPFASAPDDGPDPADPRRFSTDYLYSFGTQDALWNGAWGNFRIFRDETAPDLTVCTRHDGATPGTCIPEPVSARLRPLKEREGTGTLSSGASASPPFPLTDLVACDPRAPRARAAVAAVEAREIWGARGVSYGPNLHDPDGLVLLALDPLTLDGVLATGGGRDDLLDLIRTSHGGDAQAPYVLHVRAGECVELTVANLLPADGALADGPGDARMPAITGLNVDPARHEVRPWQAGLARIMELDADAADPRRHDVDPSARLALRIPLPSVNEAQAIALPFGWNATGALAPAGASLSTGAGATDADAAAEARTVSVERTTFYAGKMVIDEAGDLAILVSQALARARSPGIDVADPDVLAAAGLAEAEARALLDRARPFVSTNTRKLGLLAADADIELFGERFAVRLGGPLTMRGALERTLGADAGPALRLINALVRREAARLLSAQARFTPYAFGTLPVEPFGDVIGHPSHGLVGAVVVLPEDWWLEDGAGGWIAPLPRAAEGTPAPVRIVTPRPLPAGNAIAALQPPIGAACAEGEAGCEDAPASPVDCVTETGVDPACIRMRSFTLVYQDGLNLSDEGSAIHWHYRDGHSNVTGPDGAPARITPDCAICDDSYDLGDRAVSYRAPGFFDRLRALDPPAMADGAPLEADSDLNAAPFPDGFWRLGTGEAASGTGGLLAPAAMTPMPVLRSVAGEEVVIGVLEPGGRARQRAFVTVAQDYDDLFPGFGFPHSALVAPGKAIDASLSRPVRAGCYLWHDGPTHLRASGSWGLIDVVPEGGTDDPLAPFRDPGVTSCRAAEAP